MPQLLIGFLCGCVAATLVLGMLYANRKRQAVDVKEAGEDEKSPGRTSDLSKRLNVLLVDDSRLSRTVMKEYLAKRNPQIFEAENGMESLKIAQNHSFDLIFIDQCMPGMDSDETLRHLRKEGGVDSKVPIIAVGSSARKENEAEFRERGYEACLGKPIQENRLDEILERVLPDEGQTDTGGINAPEGFSYEKGLANFDGNEPQYRETLVLFADLWGERRAQLKQFLDDENMQEYAILIHAVKGDARTLGAEGLGNLAYEQELQAKAGEAEKIRIGFDKVIRAGDMTAEYFKQMNA